MRKFIVKEKESASVNIISEYTAPEKYTASELEKYPAKMGIAVGGGMTIKIQLDDWRKHSRTGRIRRK